MIRPYEPLAVEPAPEILRRLGLLRTLLVVGAAAALTVTHLGLHFPETLVPAAMVLSIYAVVTGLTHARLHLDWPVSQTELGAQVLIDVAVLTLLLYFTGGASNPMVFLYLLPVGIGATILIPGYAWVVTGVAVAGFTYLFSESLHPPVHDMRETMHFRLHLLGMWLIFVVSAVFLTAFITRIAASIRERDRMLSAAREQALRDERIVALGIMAAGAAHDLGTPLNNIALLASEMKARHNEDQETREDAEDMEAQICQCRRILSGLVAAAGEARSESAYPQPANLYLEEVLARWRAVRPWAVFQYRWVGAAPGPEVTTEPSLTQALISLLNNASDASPKEAEVVGRSEGGDFVIDILDRGPGLSSDAAARLGQPFFTTKGPGRGMGLGFFLANATIERFGGGVRVFARAGGGTCTQITLPISKP